jgi:hypothetical protein
MLLSKPAARFKGNQWGVVGCCARADSKSGGVHPPCGFDSHLRHQSFAAQVLVPKLTFRHAAVGASHLGLAGTIPTSSSGAVLAALQMSVFRIRARCVAKVPGRTCVMGPFRFYTDGGRPWHFGADELWADWSRPSSNVRRRITSKQNRFTDSCDVSAGSREAELLQNQHRFVPATPKLHIRTRFA